MCLEETSEPFDSTVNKELIRSGDDVLELKEASMLIGIFSVWPCNGPVTGVKRIRFLLSRR